MTSFYKYLKRTVSGSVALLLLVALVVPSLSHGNVLAAQMSARSITMSDSAESGGARVRRGVSPGPNVNSDFV